MDALILAAGFSRRLEPLTLTRAKPLLPVRGRPMIDYVLEKIQRIQSPHRTFVICNAKFHAGFLVWGRQHPGVVIVNDGTTHNDERLGAVGDIDLVIRSQRVEEDFLVVAGDNLFDAGLDAFANEAAAHRPMVSIGVVNLGDRELIRKRYGVVDMDPAGRVTAFYEKPDEPPTTLVSTGIYYFPASALGVIRAYVESGANRDNSGHLIQAMVQRHGVHGALLTGRWYDIGDLASYQLADRTFHQPQ